MPTRTRLRYGTAGQSSQPTGPSSQSRTTSTARLPEYQAPQFALNVNAQHKLANLYADHDFSKLHNGLASSIRTIRLSAVDINDRLAERTQKFERQKSRKRKAQVQESEEDAAQDEETQKSLEVLAAKVESLTNRMDENVRKMIDGQETLASTQTLLAASLEKAHLQASTQATIEARRSQMQQDRDARQGVDSDDDGNVEMQDQQERERTQYSEITPTDPDGATQSITGPTTHFKDKMEEWKLRNSGRTLIERYGDHNEYRNFRRVLHDAQYPDEQVPMPNAEDWFVDGRIARPGITRRGSQGSDEEDIQISKASTSTKCPITLKEFKQPLTSTKCEHTFEASAIHQMILSSTHRLHEGNFIAGFNQGDPAVRCPVQSCDNILVLADLYHDAAVVHRIERLQRAKELQDQDMADDEGGQNAELIEDDDRDDGYDIDQIEADDGASTAARVKSEGPSRRR